MDGSNSADVVYAELKLMLGAERRLILVVEGQFDVNLFGKFINEKDIVLFPAKGKDNALEIAKRLISDGHDTVAVVVDKDFDSLLGKATYIQNIIPTDYHDSEILMFESSALHKFLTEYATKNFSKTKKASATVRRHLYSKATPLSCFKFHSINAGIHFPFKDHDFTGYFDINALDFDVDKFIRTTKQKGFSFSKADITSHSGHDPKELNNGHDVLSLLGVSMKRYYGSATKDICAKENIEKCLRLAYDISDFKTSAVWKGISDWASEFGVMAFAES